MLHVRFTVQAPHSTSELADHSTQQCMVVQHPSILTS
jgi:hypothetical protein